MYRKLGMQDVLDCSGNGVVASHELYHENLVCTAKLDGGNQDGLQRVQAMPRH